MHFTFIAETDIGTTKDTNQDSILVKHGQYSGGEVLMALVCDGLGGLSKGELASATVIRAFDKWFDEELPYELEELDLHVISGKWNLMLKDLNVKLIEYSRNENITMGTTFTGILFVNNQYVISHVGDTRVYRLDNSITQLTNDQTFVAREIKKGTMTVEQAKAYGKFLAERYKDEPNIIWFIGGDIRGDVKTAEWEALATSIKAIDKNHLMTFHPRGRTTSATWFNNAPWLDFNMFQSGHRRYGQRFGDGDYPIEENTEEDNWRFVERSLAMKPMKPVIDGEPIYEEIPHGLHDENELLWKDYDVRRYAYWSVFAGSFGHTYGHNSIMQFIKPGVGGAYGAKKPWYDALNDPGYNQMKYLKNLMLTFPFFERIPDQSIITGQNGERYDRAIATRGNDYLMVYNYTGRPMEVDFSKISGAKKNAWWYTTKDGKLEYIGEFDNGVHKFQHDSGYCSGNDHILIVVDSSKNYVEKAWTELPNAQQKWAK